jgi:hypothetical protein
VVVREEHPSFEQGAFEVEFFEKTEGRDGAGEYVFHAD